MNLSRAFHALAAAVGAALLAAPAVLAAPPTGDDVPLNLQPEAPVERAVSSGGGGIVRTIVGLAIVIGVIFGLHWVLKQVKAGKEGRSAGAGLRSVATLPLGPNRALHLVRVGSELVLVGSAEDAVTGIRTYSEAEAEALGLGADDEEPPAPSRDLAELEAGPGEPVAQQLVKKLQRWTVRR